MLSDLDQQQKGDLANQKIGAKSASAFFLDWKHWISTKRKNSHLDGNTVACLSLGMKILFSGCATTTQNTLAHDSTGSAELEIREIGEDLMLNIKIKGTASGAASWEDDNVKKRSSFEFPAMQGRAAR